MSEENSIREIAAIILGASVIGLAIGMSIAMVLIGNNEGANWAWWQIVLASLTATSGAVTVAVLGLFTAAKIGAF